MDEFDELFDQVSLETQNKKSPAPDPAVVSDLSGEQSPIPSTAGPLSEGRDDDAELYGRLGGIVRSLHDSLRELGLDKSLSDAANSINDAKDRLAYIATLTEEAANKVLNTLDAAMPAQTELASRGKEVSERWDKMLSGNLSVEEFKQLALDSKAFSDLVVSESEAEKARLLDIMMAQDFQDLTGQIIKKVIGVTKSVENDLTQLLKDHAPPDVKEKIQKVQPVDLMAGPDVPTNAMNQDSVDDLLSDLGF